MTDTQTLIAPPQTGESLALAVEELARRFEEGEAVDAAAFIARYPQHETALAQLLPAMAALAQFGNSNGAALTLDPLAGVTDEAGRLGDFRIIREIGRGGMGVVYEAEQISLGRRVALKVLPFAGVLDERQLKRFKLEAAAAAALKHPNIVSVYCVGCERGVHFYAMEYVEGQTLAAVVDGLKDEVRSTKDEEATPLPAGEDRVREVGKAASSPPYEAPNDSIRPSSFALRPSAMETSPVAAFSTDYTTNPQRFFRHVAELGIQAAEALHHAHEMGIIHRDIKPANLLLDHEGQLYIADFGLARLSTDAGMTLTGDMLGTLRYMSPEQASGAKLLDERTDIYSLGVTLYELLALKPAFAENDRQKLIRQVVEQEPQRLRAINPRIPADLETVILKAIAKEPAERYASAKVLAEDLERFIRTEPIRARRATVPQKVIRWSRRHRGLVAAAAIVLVLSTGLALAAALLFAMERDRTVAALADSDRERTYATARLDVATGLLTLVGQQLASDLESIPHASKLQREILEKSLKFYEQLPQHDRDDRQLRFAQVRAMRSLSAVYGSVNDGALRHKGRGLLRQAISIQEELSENDPENTRYMRELGLLYSDYARLLQISSNRARPLLDLRTKSVAIFRRLAADEPTSANAKLDLAKALLTLALHHRDEMGMSSQDRDLSKALALSKEALTLLEGFGSGVPKHEHNQLLAHAFHRLAVCFDDLKRTTEAEPAYRKSIQIIEQLLKERPSDLEARQGAKTANQGFAIFLRRQGRFAEEQPSFQRAVELQESLVADFPERTDHLVYLVWMHGMRQAFFAEKRMWRQSRDTYSVQLKHELRLLEIHPRKSNAVFNRNASFGYANVLYELGEIDAAREAYRQVLDFAHSMLTKIAGGADDPDTTAWVAFIEATCPFPELCDYKRALEIVTRGVPKAYLDPDTDKTAFTDEHIALAMALYRAGQAEKALETLRADRIVGGEKCNLFREADRQLWRCRILLDLGQIDEARQTFEKAQAKAADIPPSGSDAIAYLARKRLFQECSEILAGKQQTASEVVFREAESR
jgi:serine/threonine protein kinase